MSKIKVLVVDDSALVRNLMTKIINGQEDMEVVAVAPDAMVAQQRIESLSPDVVTLDIEMPKMDGLQFLERLMKTKPLPVVMVSTLTERGAQATFRALELGAIDFVAKPKVDIGHGLLEYAHQITEKIRAAYEARFRLKRAATKLASNKASAVQVSNPVAQPVPATSVASALPSLRGMASDKIILIGASTGGTEAIRTVLEHLPPEVPGILITQHMPAGFTKSFAERLNQTCKITVKEAEHAEKVLPGHAYIAPGSCHLLLGRQGGQYVCLLSDGEPVNRHRPSVEVLFNSGKDTAPRHVLALMLTGMGKDGAQAMADIHKAGAYTLCQDEESCVVFGMPREAIALGAADEVLPLNAMAKRLIEYVQKTAGQGLVKA